MAIKIQPARDILARDPYTVIVDLTDRALLLFYAHVRKHARRITHLVVALLPLMALLVGSCKLSQLPWAYGGNTGPEQFRMALFPDQVNFQGADYYPAAGYVSRAQDFIAGTPDALAMLTQEEIGYLFGKPSFHRQDADAEVWQYKTGACVVDFYFYGKGSARGQSPLAYTDIRMKEELVSGSKPRVQPLATREKSNCLHDVVLHGFASVRA